MEGWELIKTVLGSPAGSFAFVAGLTALAFWVSIKMTRIATEHKYIMSRQKNVDAKIDKLGTDVQELRGDIQYVKSTLNSITNILQNNAAEASQNKPMLQAHSPLALTDVGKAAVKDMGADNALALNWETIRSILDSEIGSINPYDIQTYCLEKIPVAPERFLPQEHLDKMKIFAFNQGRTLFDCLKVFGVLVRDRYFKEHGIPLSELDKRTTSAS